MLERGIVKKMAREMEQKQFMEVVPDMEELVGMLTPALGQAGLHMEVLLKH